MNLNDKNKEPNNYPQVIFPVKSLNLIINNKTFHILKNMRVLILNLPSPSSIITKY